MPILYNENYLYSGSMFVGESNQEMKLIYDTGSDWMVVEGRDCKDCEGARYDPNTSSYYKVKNVLDKPLKYGNYIHLVGKEVDDQICLQEFAYCIEPYHFLLVNQQVQIISEI